MCEHMCWAWAEEEQEEDEDNNIIIALILLILLFTHKLLFSLSLRYLSLPRLHLFFVSEYV